MPLRMKRSYVRRMARGAAAAVLSLTAQGAIASDFEEKLARVDHALVTNPGQVSAKALDSCVRQRNSASRLYGSNRVARAERSLAYCFEVLHISPERALPKEVTGPSIAETQAKAAREVERALALEADVARGLEIYRDCAQCHTPEGWGLTSGLVPQIAGQHRSVVIKQLADIRAGHRDTVVMAPYASVEVIGGVHAVADVAGYIDTLEINTAGGKGPGTELERGEALYREHCASCHGAAGEGDAKAFVPRIQAQHFDYLVRQFEWLRDGKRRNGDAEMQARIEGLDEGQMFAVLDYVSRLEPPEDLRAPPGWKNPDFAE